MFTLADVAKRLVHRHVDILSKGDSNEYRSVFSGEVNFEPDKVLILTYDEKTDMFVMHQRGDKPVTFSYEINWTNQMPVVNFSYLSSDDPGTKIWSLAHRSCRARFPESK